MSFNRVLRAALARLGAPSVGLSSSRGPRRGIFRQSLVAGSPWSAFVPPGTGRSPDFRGDLALSLVVVLGVAQPFSVDFDPDSAGVDPGQLLFQSITRRNFNRVLIAALARLGAPSADLLCSRGFRRGTSRGMMVTGSPWPAGATLGIWHSPAFRGYLDMSIGVERGAAQLISVDFDSDSAAVVPADASGAPSV